MSRLFVTLRVGDHQALLSMGILQARILEGAAVQGIFLIQGSNPGFPILQVDSLLSEPPGRPRHKYIYALFLSQLNSHSSRKTLENRPFASWLWALGQGRAPLLDFGATKGLHGVGVVGEGSYIRAFKMLLNTQGNMYQDIQCSFACRSKHF